MATSGATNKKLPPPKTYDEYFTGVTAWLRDRWGTDDPLCGYCHDERRGWVILAALDLIAAPGWPRLLGTPPGVAPMVPVSCENCGQTVFIPALLVFEPQSEGEK